MKDAWIQTFAFLFAFGSGYVANAHLWGWSIALGLVSIILGGTALAKSAIQERHGE